jgi:4-hydroxythreonine-4-phosphate dehydrogenase
MVPMILSPANMRPLLLVTMGDVAGIGPEIIARAWPDLHGLCRPLVVGDPEWMGRALKLVGSRARVYAIRHPHEGEATPDQVPCLLATDQDLGQVEPGRVSAAAGQAAYDFLCAAIDWTKTGAADGIVTAPLHKEGLRAAGLPYPGHTEILAERTGTRAFAMLLYCDGLAVAHVTLHMALRDVFRHLTAERVLEKIRLLDTMVERLLNRRPRLGVAALNPHASDGGLFGDEEATIIAPAVTAARAEGVDVTGPWPCDTLFVRARRGEFDGIVAMYHDQGHIALKLLGGIRAVNISAGLPIVRTSVAHGTAYDIAGRGVADADGLVEAVRVAARLASSSQGGARHEDLSLSHPSRSDGSQPGPAGAVAGPTP